MVEHAHNTGRDGEDAVSPRDLLANLITTHRGHMDDPRWLTHIELADLMLQALDVEGLTVTRLDQVGWADDSEPGPPVLMTMHFKPKVPSLWQPVYSVRGQQ